MQLFNDERKLGYSDHVEYICSLNKIKKYKKFLYILYRKSVSLNWVLNGLLDYVYNMLR